MFDTPVDYETLAQLGSIMGSGGMVVMDEDNCMVDVARYFVEFTHSESCGKCVPCRVGLDKSLEILNRFTQGTATEADLATLDELGRMIRDMSLCGLGQTAPNPVLTTMRHFRQEFEDHIRASRCRAGVCEELALSPCENSCPLHMNIPRYLQLVKEDRLEEAFLSVFVDNPFPASTGRVCQHPCENRCRREGIDEAVNMREVHRFIADAAFESERFDAMADQVASRRLAPTGKRIAVVGAGPAGLTCAFYLSLLGHDCTVYDPNPAPGGMLRYALPEYRLPKAILDKECEIIRRAGVRFVGNTRVGAEIQIAELEEQYDALFVATGTWKESWVNMPGNDLKGVFSSLRFLEAESNDKETALGRNVVVIGGGNSAVDAARTSLRRGARVTIVYRRERKDMPAIPEETAAAEAEGARIVFLAAPQRIRGDKDGRVQAIEVIKTRLGEFDKSGRRRPIPTDETMRIECDTVIFAVGEGVDSEFARAAGVKIRDNGLIEVDRYSMVTNREKVYAGGDIISGATNVSNAMGYGKKAARLMDERLTGNRRFAQVFPEFEYDDRPPAQPSESRRHLITELPADERVTHFKEVAVGLTPVEAMEESCRCLRCDVRNGDH
jgi:NADH-quinone oxidoreductase subunit F